MTRGGPRRGSGRPLKAGGPATIRLVAYCSEATAAEIQAGAQQMNVSVSDVLRDGGLRLVRSRR